MIRQCGMEAVSAVRRCRALAASGVAMRQMVGAAVSCLPARLGILSFRLRQPVRGES